MSSSSSPFLLSCLLSFCFGIFIRVWHLIHAESKHYVFWIFSFANQMASLLVPGKRENNLLSTISLGFSFSSFQHAIPLLPVVCAPRGQCGQPRRQASSISLSLRMTPHLLRSSTLVTSLLPTKSKINNFLNFHLFYMRYICFKTVIGKQ